MIQSLSKMRGFFKTARQESIPHLQTDEAVKPAASQAFDDRNQLNRLQRLMSDIPTERDSINLWTVEASHLIDKLVVSQLSTSDIASILAGLISYQKTGVTSAECHQAFIRAFGKSSGLFQEVLHYALFPRLADIVDEQPVSPHFGWIETLDRSQILRKLNNEGYCVLPFRLSSDTLDELNRAARNIRLMLRDRQGEDVAAFVENLDPANPPRCGAANAKSDDLATHKVFADLARDPLITSIASEYLETPVSVIDSGLWYSFPSASPSSELAQLFHYDLDTIRWLKAFYYLSDVTDDAGPHAYVEGSHKSGTKSMELLDRGYVRIPDNDMAEKQSGAVRTVTGPAGTIILGDTRAYHKGNRVKAGYRLIFSPIYAASKISYVQGQ